MPKLVTFTLTKVKYSGKAIGDDILVEIGYKDSILKVKRKIKIGSEISLNEKIGEELTTDSILTAKMYIKVTENDGIFDDEGAKDVEIKVDVTKETPQISTYDIEVHERRTIRAGVSKAIFSISIQAVVSSFFYVTSESDGGWITVVRLDNSEKISLPECLKVGLDFDKDNRHYITIQEGRLKGVKASVKISDRGILSLTHRNEQTGSASLVYSISKKTLTWGEESFQAKDNPSYPWKIGLCNVEIPDFPHDKAMGYLTQARYAMVWFPIEFQNESRYLHPGLISLGCVTIMELKKWDNFCKKLMRSRIGDGKHVGTLEVIK